MLIDLSDEFDSILENVILLNSNNKKSIRTAFVDLVDKKTFKEN